jgi:hypothetical protein
MHRSGVGTRTVPQATCVTPLAERAVMIAAHGRYTSLGSSWSRGNALTSPNPSRPYLSPLPPPLHARPCVAHGRGQPKTPRRDECTLAQAPQCVRRHATRRSRDGEGMRRNATRVQAAHSPHPETLTPGATSTSSEGGEGADARTVRFPTRTPGSSRLSARPYLRHAN